MYGGRKIMNEWRNFKEGSWCNEINVSDFIKNNYKPYKDGEEFLVGPTEKTKRVLKIYEDVCKEESLNLLIKFMIRR